MITIPPALLARLRAETTHTAICWRIEKSDGTFVLGTDHDTDLFIDSGSSPDGPLDGLYLAGSNITGSDIASSSDLSVDNMEVTGAFPKPGDLRVDVNVADLRAGLFNMAPTTVFLCDWQAPNDGQLILRRGFLGVPTWNSDGTYSTEVRGLSQLLAQIFIDAFSEQCIVKRFGDAQCKVDVVALTVPGAVTSVTDRQHFAATVTTGSPEPDGGYFRGGEFTFTSGANEGYMREVKLDNNGGANHFAFWEPFPEDVAPGDTFIVAPGCDRSATACMFYGNILNFRGYGIYIPGIDALTQGPT